LAGPGDGEPGVSSCESDCASDDVVEEHALPRPVTHDEISEDPALYYSAEMASCSEFFSDSEQDGQGQPVTAMEEGNDWEAGAKSSEGMSAPIFFCLLD